MSAIREEVVKLSKFKGDEEMYDDDRQEYLSALLVAIDKLSERDYDKLSENAYEWHTEAVKAKDNDQEIPDFPDAEPVEETGPVEGEADSEPAADEDGDGDEDGPGDGEGDDATGDDEDEPVAAEPEPPAQPARKTKALKKAEKARSNKTVDEKPTPGRAKNFPNKRDYPSLTGETDRFGVIIGTKTHEAVMMYEKGCTAKQLEDTIGGRYYNILKKLKKDGHRLEKLPGGVWKLTHRDEISKSKKK